MTNSSNLDGITSIPEAFAGVNTELDGFLGSMMLLLIFVLMFMMLRSRTDTKTIFVVASFTTLILGSLMWYIDFIAFKIIIYPFLLLLASIMFYLFSDK